MNLAFRTASDADLPRLVAMLADDMLGAERESSSDPLPESYSKAFEAIAGDPHNEIIVAEYDHAIVGFLQLTFIPYLTYQGSWRALIEGVRVASEVRGSGVGSRLITHALERAKMRGCHMVQLTTDKQRPDALRFYEDLGFAATHEGMKLHLRSLS